uniref:Uncharacterized protein n=1 Tax=Arundo donax TaxID=35708 RepID=A0A0A8YY49_ARUDO
MRPCFFSLSNNSHESLLNQVLWETFFNTS